MMRVKVNHRHSPSVRVLRKFGAYKHVVHEAEACSNACMGHIEVAIYMPGEREKLLQRDHASTVSLVSMP